MNPMQALVITMLIVSTFVAVSAVSQSQDRRTRAAQSTNGSISAKIAASPASIIATVGTPFTVDVLVDGGGQAFNAAQATVSVSPNLSVTNLTNPSSNPCNFVYAQTPTTSDLSFAGAILGSSSNNCTVYTLTLTPLSSGTGTITFTNGSIKAYSNNGEILSSVKNGAYTLIVPTTAADTIPPVVTITFPTNNRTVSRGSNTAITATASDNVGVTKVEFLVNSVLKCTDTTAPYSCVWSVPNIRNVRYTLSAKAYDARLNTATSTFTVTAK